METASGSNLIVVNNGSYRTYEEWKRIAKKHNSLREIGFLPYLWGMET